MPEPLSGATVLRAKVLAVLVGVPVLLVATLAYVDFTATPVVLVTETQWSEGGYVFLTNHTPIRMGGGSEFEVQETGQFLNCGASPTVSAPFSLTSYTCENSSYAHHPGWTILLRAPSQSFQGPLTVYLPS